MLKIQLFSDECEKNAYMFDDKKEQLHAVCEAISASLEVQGSSSERDRARDLAAQLAPHLEFLAHIVGGKMTIALSRNQGVIAPRPSLLLFERFATNKKARALAASLLHTLYREKPDAKAWLMIEKDADLASAMQRSDLAVLCALSRTVEALTRQAGTRETILATGAVLSMIIFCKSTITPTENNENEIEITKGKEDLARCFLALAAYSNTCQAVRQAGSAGLLLEWMKERWELYATQLLAHRVTISEVSTLAIEEDSFTQKIEAVQQEIMGSSADDFESQEKLSELNSQLVDLQRQLKRFQINAASTRKELSSQKKALKIAAASLGLFFRSLCMVVCDDNPWQLYVTTNLPAHSLKEKTEILELSPGLDEDIVADASGIRYQWYVLHLTGCLVKHNPKTQEILASCGLVEFLCERCCSFIQNDDKRWIQLIEVIYWMSYKSPENSALVRHTGLLKIIFELACKGDSAFIFNKGSRRSLLIPVEALPGSYFNALGGQQCEKLLHGNNRDGSANIISLLSELIANDPPSAEFLLQHSAVEVLAQLCCSSISAVVAASYKCINNLLGNAPDACPSMHPSMCSPHCHLNIVPVGTISRLASEACLQAAVLDQACQIVLKGVEGTPGFSDEHCPGEAWNLLTGPDSIGPRAGAMLCLGLLSLLQPQLQLLIHDAKNGAVWEVLVESIQGTLPDLTTEDQFLMSGSSTQLIAAASFCLACLLMGNVLLQEAFGMRDDVLAKLLSFLEPDSKDEAYTAQLFIQAARLLGASTSLAVAVRERVANTNGVRYFLRRLSTYSASSDSADCAIFTIEALENTLKDCRPAQDSFSDENGWHIIAEIIDLQNSPGLRTIRAAAAKVLCTCLSQRRDFRDISKVTIASLVKLIDIGDSEEKNSAVAALEQAVYQHNENMKVAISEGSIEFLISVIRRGGDASQGIAALHVVNLCKMNVSNLITLVDSGGVAPIVMMLKSSSVQTACAGAQVAAQLSKEKYFCSDFILCGGDHALLALLKSEDTRTLRYVCESLGFLASTQSSDAVNRRNSTLVTRLVTVSVQPEYSEACQFAANCLAYLTEDENLTEDTQDDGKRYINALINQHLFMN